MFKSLLFISTSFAVAQQQQPTLRGRKVTANPGMDSQTTQEFTDLRSHILGMGKIMLQEKSSLGSTPEQNFEGIISKWLDGLSIGDLQCPLSGDTEGQPTCSYDLDGAEGVWVCRNTSNPFTGVSQLNSVCTGENYTIGAIDTCGCCDNVCPTPCDCPCELEDGGQGVRVLFSIDFFGFPIEFEQCMNGNVAVSILDQVEFMSCVADCTTPVKEIFLPGLGPMSVNPILGSP